MNKKPCYDHFTEEFYNFIKEHGKCEYCHKIGTITEFVNRHGRIMAKCNQYTCRGELWAGCYQDAYKGFLGKSFLPGISPAIETNPN